MTSDALLVHFRFVSGTVSARMALFPATGHTPLECETYAVYELGQVVRSKMIEYKSLKSTSESSNLILLVRRGDDDCQVNYVRKWKMNIISFDLRGSKVSVIFMDIENPLSLSHTEYSLMDNS